MTTMADIYKQYREATRGLEASADQERQRIATEVTAQEGKIAGQRATLRSQLNTILGELEASRLMEMRKRDLRLVKPSPELLAHIKESKADVREQAAKYRAELDHLLAKLKTAEATALTDIASQAKAQQRKIDKWRREASKQYKEYEKAAIVTTAAIPTKEWEAKHHQLATDEWIDKTEYDKLDKNAKDYINKYGIGDFNEYYVPAQKWLAETTEAKFYAENMQLASGDWISKADYLKLDADSQNYIQEHGIEKYAIHVDSINKVLDDLKPYTDKEGNIDLVSAVKYKAATTDEFTSVGISETAIKEATHYAGIGKARTFWEGMTPWEEWKGERVTTKGAGEMAAVMLVPGVWAKDWNEMTTKWRAINIAIDIAFLIPFVGWIAKGVKIGTIGLRGLSISSKAIRATNRAAKAASTAHTALAKATKTLQSIPMGAKGYTKAASRVQHLAQASMKADKAFATSLSKLTKVTPRQLAKFEKLSKMPGIKKSVIEVGNAQKELGKAWSVLDKYKVGSKAYLQQLPKVQRSQIRLDVALGKFDKAMRPRHRISKAAGWDRIIGNTEKELQRAEAELERLLVKQKQGLHVEATYLKSVRDTIKSLKAELSNFKADRLAGISPPLAKGYKMGWSEIPKAEPDKLISDIEGFLGQRKGIPEPGIQQPLPFTGGGVAAPTKVAIKVATKVKARPMPKISKLKLKPVYEPAPKIPKAKTEIPSAFPGVTPKPKVYRPPTREAAEIMVYEAIILPATRGLTKTQQMAAVQVATRAAVRNAVKAATQGETQAQIKGQVEMALKPLTKIVPEPRVKAIANTIVKVTPKITTKLRIKAPVPKPKVRPKPRIPTIIIPLPDGKSRLLTKREAEGIIAWRQGLFYKMLYHPYGQKQVVNSRKPIAGVKYYKGVGSAAKSIIAKKGRVPAEVKRDMGIMKITIKTPWHKGSKPKIHFSLKQLTKEQIEGIIAWKQGFIFRMIYPPYGVAQEVNSRTPIEGVKYHRGAGSAYKSVISKGGKIPRKLMRDMGAFDITFRRPARIGGKPKMQFKRDRYQRTTVTPSIKTIPGISGVR